MARTTAMKSRSLVLPYKEDKYDAEKLGHAKSLTPCIFEDVIEAMCFNG